jgi:hypothetical protein
LDRKQADWAAFEKLRQLRNRFVHSLGQDVSRQLRADLHELMDGDTGLVIDSGVVYKAVEVIASIAQRLDLAYSSH